MRIARLCLAFVVLFCNVVLYVALTVLALCALALYACVTSFASSQRVDRR